VRLKKRGTTTTTAKPEGLWSYKHGCSAKKEKKSERIPEAQPRPRRRRLKEFAKRRDIGRGGGRASA